MSMHTPGPWKADGRRVAQDIETTPWGRSGELICQCSLAPDDAAGEANARLIAAAPDLLSVAYMARGLVDAIAAIIADDPDVARFLPGLPSVSAAIHAATVKAGGH